MFWFSEYSPVLHKFKATKVLLVLQNIWRNTWFSETSCLKKKHKDNLNQVYVLKVLKVCVKDMSATYLVGWKEIEGQTEI